MPGDRSPDPDRAPSFNPAGPISEAQTDSIVHPQDGARAGINDHKAAGQRSSTHVLGEADHSSPGRDVPVPPDLVDHPRYQVIKFLGAGGMGTVYKARHRLMDRIVAVKILGRHLVSNPLMANRFRREVMATAVLHHPNIVTAFDADQVGDTHFLAMEFVAGVPMDRVLATRGRLPVAEACGYASQAAAGLQHAHERGMVHRDVKPHNLMLTTEGTVKILDFGLARYASEALSLDPDSTDFLLASPPPPAQSVNESANMISSLRGPGLTTGYVLMGTADYMAPEEWVDARRADTRADIYGLGCTLYHLLAGRVPFPGGEPAEKLDRHRLEVPEPLDQVRADIPPFLAAVVSRMLAKNPEDRYQSPAEAALALAPFTGLAERRVLVVAGSASGVVQALRDHGFTVDTAADWREAVSRAQTEPRPELVLLDLGDDGERLCQFLRENPDAATLDDVPVVTVTATNPRQAVAVALGAAESLVRI